MAESLFDKINIDSYVDGWAKITIELWQKELKKKKIGVTGDLEKSFKEEVKLKGSELAEIILSFKMYGRFRDMNVGRGLKSFERSENKAALRDRKKYGLELNAVNRREKRWLNKIKTSQTYRLAELLGMQAANTVINDFNNTNNITIKING